MGILADIFSYSLDIGNGQHADVLIGGGDEPDQYAMWNPLQHPRDPSGHFAKKAGSDDSGAAMAMDAPGPGVEGGEMPPMQAPPLPPARAAVARIELPEKIDHRIKEVARHIPDYFLDGNGRTKTAHITIKMFSEDEPEDIAKVLQGEAPFRVVLGKVNIIEATESRPYDILKVDVHSPAIRRLHNKLSESLSGIRGGNGYQPFIKIADVQPGMGDRLIGWDGLEGESVVVKNLTFVRKDHTAHEIPLQGRQDEYQLDEYSQPMAYSMPEQYAKRKKPGGPTPLFDRPVQQEVRPPEESQTFAPASAPRQQSLGIERTPSQPASPEIETPLPSSHVTQSSTMDAPGDTDIPSLPDMTPNTKGPRDESVPTSIEPAVPDDTPGTPSNGPGESLEDFGRGRHDGDDSGGSSQPVDTGISGPKGIKTAREQFTPPVESIDTSIVPETVRDYLKPFQLADTAMALHAMTTHGGFLNAGGTGSGKSWSQVAVAKYWMDKGMKVLLVTPNEVVSPNWETGQIHGAFKSAGQKMNAMPRLNDGSKALNPGEFHVTTYHRFHDLESQVDENTVVLWDESHLLKNLTSGRSQVGDRMNQKANSVMYSTATPADKPIHIAHLSRAKVFGNRPPEATYKELGLEPYADEDKEGKEHINWRISPDVGPLEVSRRLNGLFNRMTEEGLMVKRDLDMTGVRVKTRKIELSPEAHDILKKIEAEATDGMGLHSLRGRKKGVLLQHLRRQQETFKVPHIVDSIKEALAENPNRQIVVYVSRVNPADVTYRGKVIHSSRGTPELIKKAFEGVKGVRIGELHGGSQNDPHASMRNFQEGATNVLIATMERGGIGIDLDDQVGNRPRTMIVATAPFSGDRNVQAGGRVWRETTKSKHGDTVIDYMFGDTEIDDWNQGIIATKMRTLGAVVEGEARSLDVNIPFDIGEEALEELAQSDASERIRRRDAIAKSQMHEPYRWRQLTGLEDIKPEVQPSLGMEGVEDLKPGDPGYHAMMMKRDKQAGYKPTRPRQKRTVASGSGQQSLFTQDGEPERYTMTAAEINEAVKSWKEPSKAQWQAENYHKPRIHIHGMEIAIENPKGSVRKVGHKPLAHHYGYCAKIAGAPAPEARDFDKIDVFIGPNPASEIVFVVDQEHPSGRYDEPKVLMGFTNLREARKGYLDNYPSGWHCGPITALTVNQFRAWLETGDTKKRIAEQVSKYAAEYGPGEMDNSPSLADPAIEQAIVDKDEGGWNHVGYVGSSGKHSNYDFSPPDQLDREESRQKRWSTYLGKGLYATNRKAATGYAKYEGDGTIPTVRPVFFRGKMLPISRREGIPEPDLRNIIDAVLPQGQEGSHPHLRYGFLTTGKTNSWDFYHDLADHVGGADVLNARLQKLGYHGIHDKQSESSHPWQMLIFDKNAARIGKDVGSDYETYSQMHRTADEQVSKYAAKYDFDDLHPRDNDTKRFIPKHKSVALAQAAKRPATPGEKRAYKKYAAFVRVGGTDPLPFKKWLQFHRAEKFRTQEQEIQRDSAEQEGSEASQVQDQAATGGQDQAETQPERPSRSTGEPSRNSLIHNFATALYNSYYHPSK